MPYRNDFAVQRHQYALYMKLVSPYAPPKPRKASGLARWPDVCCTPADGHLYITYNAILYSDPSLS